MIIERLLALGADVRAADPHVTEGQIDPRVTLVEATMQEAADADLVIVVTAHDAFDFDAVLASGTPILDTRHRLEGPSVEYL